MSKIILSSCDFRNNESAKCIYDNLPCQIDQCKVLYFPNEKATEEAIKSIKFYQRLSEFGFTNEECDLALDHFHDYFGERGWNDNIPYEGILPMLARVKASGVTVALATSKPMVYAKPICDLFGITPYIDFLGAADTDKTRDKKWEVIEYVLLHYPEISRERTVIVGDRHFDADGAHTTGIHCIGVTYGYGSLEEVENAGFDAVVHTVEEIPNALVED